MSPRPPSYFPFSPRKPVSSRPRTLLPHFSSAVAKESPRRLKPEDFSKTPLEKSIDELKRVKTRVRESFARMNQTHTQFDSDLQEASRIVNLLEAEQRNIVQVYSNLLDFSARQIQRCFRGHLGRRLFRQTLVIRAVLRVQRGFREFHRRKDETRKKSRVLYRKVLRGLRGVRERSDLSHSELLNRVGHNLQVEAQWRKAMGVEDTENDLITALYRKKYVRRKLGVVFRHLYWLHSITTYWKTLVPQPEPISVVDMFEMLENEQLEGQSEASNDVNESEVEQKIVIVAPRGRKQVKKFINNGSNREELINRQKLTMREIKHKKEDELRKEGETVKRIRKNIATDMHLDRTRRRGGNK
ncbi:hypothetical protein P3T76_011658 [Phytophthora citrophthora]|uniref:Uncharacterized protein n=1 Tax=Phytophthora citrophthora TaxID=4793 RepID=A0AAD9G8Q8_9STRA|nr:hypothetical protein P3T76_011658 [Phytophthora citrophthora]